MKINFSSLFQTPLQKYRFFLLFGNDKNVFERATAFLQKKLNLALKVKSEADLLSNPFSPPSLFDGQEDARLSFVISPVTDKIVPLLDQLKEGRFIFVSEKARTQSKIVTHFTHSPTCLAIASYASPITPAEFEFLSEGIVLSSPFKNLVFKTYQNDYLGLLGALQKIKLYGDVPDNQIENFLQNISSFEELSPLLHAFLMKDLKKATERVSALASTDIIPLIRTLSRSFQALFELLTFKETQNPIPWQSLSSPIFFKEKPLFEAALSKWRKEDVGTLLETLLDFEKKMKFSTLAFPHLRQGLLHFLKR